MKKCEKESFYSLFRVALECIEGFKSSVAMPNVSDDELLDNETSIKVLLVILFIIFNPILEMLGFVDSVFKLRESYIIMKKGR